MPRIMRDEDFEEDELRQDKEITLGPAMIFGIAGGLLLLCALCFGLGYTTGRSSGARATAALQITPGPASAAQPDSTLSKPAATSSTPATEPAPVDATPTQPDENDAPPPEHTQASHAPAPASAPATLPDTPPNQVVVHQALPATGAPAPEAVPLAADAEPNGFMVQV
ncbi:MAG TPA: hypothetical protein VK716_15260, partial [Terracidiphilus sp.]|nr:hypothetical protein [Terracidiphilus sp.]